MKRVLAMTLCAMSLVIVSGWVFSADWPGWRGPGGDAFSCDKGINKDWTVRPPKELWRIPLSDAGHAGPAAANGKVFIVDHQDGKDVVRAIDIATGKDVWTYAYEDAKAENWGYTRATPLINGGKVYTIGMAGNVLCLNEADGSLVWRKNLIADFGGRQPQWPMAASPAIDGNKLILIPGAEEGAVLALNKETGEKIWQGGPSDKPGYATPVVAVLNGKQQYIMFLATMLAGIDPESGACLWQFPWKTKYDVNAATPVVVGGDTVFITSGYSRGCALVKVTANGAEKVWENKAVCAHFNSPVLDGGYLYCNSDPGDLVCLDAKTGAAAWKQEGFEKGGLLAVDGCLIAQEGSSGALVLCEMSPKGYKELGRINAFPTCRKRAWAPPIVADMKLIARDLKELVCYDLK